MKNLAFFLIYFTNLLSMNVLKKTNIVLNTYVTSVNYKN